LAARPFKFEQPMQQSEVVKATHRPGFELPQAVPMTRDSNEMVNKMVSPTSEEAVTKQIDEFEW
jgi:hypothetical protein